METKKSFILMIVTLALVAVLLVFTFVNMAAGGNRPVLAGAPAAAAGQAPAGDVIAVYGQGRMTVKPDIAYITLGVETSNADPKEAQDHNAAEMANVTAAVKNAGIAEVDIQTAGYDVYQNNDSNGKMQGYKVTNLVQVTVKELGKAGAVIKAAYDAGANRFSGIRFDIIERQKAYLQAVDMAAERAYEKADFLAKKTGRKLSQVSEVEEASSGNAPYYSPYSNFAVGQGAADAMADYAGTISSGELVITAVVNVKYKLE